jgi:hypothetical protein
VNENLAQIFVQEKCTPEYSVWQIGDEKRIVDLSFSATDREAELTSWSRKRKDESLTRADLLLDALKQNR